MKKISLLIVFITIVLSTNLLNGQNGICFSSFQNNTFSSGMNNKFQVVGDLNNDGYSDLISFSETSTNISVMLNNNGTIPPPTLIPVGVIPVSPVLADFNNDTILDLAFSSYNTSQISVMLGDGNGSFTSTYTISAGTPKSKLVAIDFNEDSKLDIVIGYELIATNLVELIGDGSGQFSYFNQNYVPYGPTDMIVVDFNNDSHDDIAILNEASNNVVVYNGNGAGVFSYGCNFIVPNIWKSLCSADVNNDGNIDLILPTTTNSVSS